VRYRLQRALGDMFGMREPAGGLMGRRLIVILTHKDDMAAGPRLRWAQHPAGKGQHVHGTNSSTHNYLKK
jgi:hypothetical protein